MICCSDVFDWLTRHHVTLNSEYNSIIYFVTAQEHYGKVAIVDENSKYSNILQSLPML